MKRELIIALLIGLLGFYACKEDDPELGDPPSAADAAFVFTPSTDNPNVINFKANNTSVIAIWDFGNGTSSQGASATATYPRRGTYTVKLTIFTSGGSAESTQDVVIASDDLSLLSDSLYTFLTGGVDSVNGKTWVIDSNSVGHMGVGPNPPGPLGLIPEWWAAPPNDKSGVGLYNDRYTFYLDAFKFDMVTKGDIYVHTDHQGDFPGAFQNKGDYTAPYTDQLNESWLLNFDAGSDTTLTISGNAFLGFYTNVQTYRIISISENEIKLRYLHDGNDMLSWYLTLIPEGHVPTGGGGSTGASLPIDFETVEPTFDPFGGSTATVINNPDSRPGSINTSSRVLETVHGNETWAGVSVDLERDLDFSSDTSISVKIWSPVAGSTMRIKIEDQDDSNVFIEKDVSVPVAFNWVEVSVGFSGAASGTYNKIALFPGWGVASSNTFYLDDIQQK